jgi:GT2 family glycosyltransferase
MPSVRVIIVNFNAGEALITCVDAVLDYSGSLQVVVADNASEDGSMAALEAHFGAEPRLATRYNSENLGFASAVNRIALAADEDYVLVLNPDCVLGSGALGCLVEALEQDKQAGLAGPWITDTQGNVQSGTWRRLPNPWQSLMSVTGLHRLSGQMPAFSGVNEPGKTAPEGVIQAEAVSGACMLVRRAAAESVGYFDEAYAMHCEDLDLMHRLKTAGFHCLLVPEATAVHRGGVSSASRPWWVHRQKHLGMQRYFNKFLASEHSLPGRWLICTGIWIHYLLGLPAVLFRRLVRSA